MSFKFQPFKVFLFLFFGFYGSSPHELHPLIANSTSVPISQDFPLINRRHCGHWDKKYHGIRVTSNPSLTDDEIIEVEVTAPEDYHSKTDWVGMMSPANSNYRLCPHFKHMYEQTGDTTAQPLTCHSPVKAQVVNYLNCKNKVCRKYKKNICQFASCSAKLTFEAVNFRSSIGFIFFGGGFDKPCFLAKSQTVGFAHPKKPLYAHVSSRGSKGTKMRVTWVSGDWMRQQVQYEGGKTKKEIFLPTTFRRGDMCGAKGDSPAKDFGWHDPGWIHSVSIDGLRPSEKAHYRYGSDSAGWSELITMKTPPAAGSDELRFLAFGDMGRARRDESTEHFDEPGSSSVVKAMKQEVDDGKVDSIFHIGGLSYATGFLVVWDYFLHQITPLASQVPYMTAVGEYERDYPGSKSFYVNRDSGGECGVPYQKYFRMPATTPNKPWYSASQGSVHFTVISTEHDWTNGSRQYQWMMKNMARVNRTITPWLIFIGHRTMYSSAKDVDKNFAAAVEPLLLKYKVDLAIWGHVHNYERTCNVNQGQCLGMPKKDANDAETYNSSNYTAPVHVVVGTGGFTLDPFSNNEDAGSWSLAKVSKFGYLRVHATKQVMRVEFVDSSSKAVEDKFQLVK